MATSVSICSNALILLGQKPIASFTEATTSARVAANLYPDAKRDFQRAHPWNACIQRVTLAPEATAPAFGFKSRFLLPAECLRVLSASDDGMEFKVEGRSILADATVLHLRYIADTDEGLWTGDMVQALTLRMAASMAHPVAASAALGDSMAQQAERAMKRAKAVDGQEDTPEAIEDSPLYAARFPGGGW